MRAASWNRAAMRSCWPAAAFTRASTSVNSGPSFRPMAEEVQAPPGPLPPGPLKGESTTLPAAPETAEAAAQERPLTLKGRFLRWLAFALPRLIVLTLRIRWEGKERFD